MAQQNRTTLKGFFETGDVPTQQNYADFIDSKLSLADTENNPQVVSSGISASLLDSATSITAKNNITAGGLLIASTGSFLSHITASGNISSSATGSFAKLTALDYLDLSTSGHITASGNISASGNIIATQLTGSLNATEITVGGNISVASIISSGDISTRHITASGNISASGFIQTTSHITASGNISSSGNIIGDHFIGQEGFRLIENNSSTVTVGHQNDTPIIIGKSANPTSIMGHITASGNISASGDIVNTGNITSDSTGSFQVLSSPAFIGSRPIKTIAGGNYTLLLTDAGTYNRCGSHQVRIHTNSTVAFAIGTEIEFIQTSSEGHLLITSASNAITLNSRNQLFSASGQFSAISCKKVGVDEWDIIGDLTA